MALPEDFSPWDHLRLMLLSTHNRNVQQSFLGVPDDDLSSSLGGLKVACLLQDDDTVDMFVLRFFLFYFVLEGHLPVPVYGMPAFDYQSAVRFHPQVHLHFAEDLSLSEKAEKLIPIRSDLSFRLVSQTSQTITPAYARTLAIRIKEVFGTGNGFTWERGPVKVTYRDPDHGYDLYIYAVSEAEAVRLIERILLIQEHAFNESFVVVHNARKAFSNVAGTQEIYGKVRKKPRERPTVSVRFRKAELHIHGLAKPIVLMGPTGIVNPLNVSQGLI